ncbi:hypothetical protein M5K25_001734 [Dendrobium thyrsiflorum]|uniref:Uncharacterized protein n=1 Tax=Dendrobium thyrsiflorum TaxID=117978 RepID=A0ABD0VRA6_DENTH
MNHNAQIIQHALRTSIIPKAEDRGHEHAEPEFGEEGEATPTGGPALPPIPPPALAYPAYPHDDIIQRLEQLKIRLDSHIPQQRQQHEDDLRWFGEREDCVTAEGTLREKRLRDLGFERMEKDEPQTINYRPGIFSVPTKSYGNTAPRPPKFGSIETSLEEGLQIPFVDSASQMETILEQYSSNDVISRILIATMGMVKKCKRKIISPVKMKSHKAHPNSDDYPPALQATAAEPNTLHLCPSLHGRILQHLHLIHSPLVLLSLHPQCHELMSVAVELLNSLHDFLLSPLLRRFNLVFQLTDQANKVHDHLRLLVLKLLIFTLLILNFHSLQSFEHQLHQVLFLFFHFLLPSPALHL